MRDRRAAVLPIVDDEVCVLEILDNEDGYLFASITASYECEVAFKPINGDGLGMFEMEACVE